MPVVVTVNVTQRESAIRGLPKNASGLPKPLCFLASCSHKAQDRPGLAGGPGFVPASAAAPTPDGNGYVIVTLGGTVYGFGDAPVTGSIQAGPTSYGPATAVFLDAQNNGGWVAYANGLVAAFGGAPFLGDAGGLRLNEPVTAGAGF